MKGNLKLLALKYLKNQGELSGTEIIEKVEKGTGWTPSPGTLYPLLDKLDKEGLLESEKRGRSRKFRITEKGEEKFTEFQEEQEKYWGQIIQSLRNYKEMFDEEELEDFIYQLEQAKQGNYEIPYPQMLCYQIMDSIKDYEQKTDEKQEKIDETLEKTLETVEDLK